MRGVRVVFSSEGLDSGPFRGINFPLAENLQSMSQFLIDHLFPLFLLPQYDDFSLQLFYQFDSMDVAFIAFIVLELFLESLIDKIVLFYFVTEIFIHLLYFQLFFLELLPHLVGLQRALNIAVLTALMFLKNFGELDFQVHNFVVV